MSPAWRFIAAAAAVGAAFLAGGFLEPVQVTLSVVAGRSPHCPWGQALHAGTHAGLIERTKDQILSRSRLVRRSADGLELWETPHGNFWIPHGMQYTLPFNLAEQELNIYETERVRIRPGDTVLDCGANVGVYTRAALEAGAGKVVAIEPLPENLECLRRSFSRQITDGRVILVPKGVWDREDQLELHVDEGAEAAASLVMGTGARKRSVTVPLTTIDRLVEELGLERVDFIKMDIEGAETNALRGARKTLARWRPKLAVSAYHLPADPAEIPLEVLRANAAYEQSCGACEALDDHIRPVVLFFW